MNTVPSPAEGDIPKEEVVSTETPAPDSNPDPLDVIEDEEVRNQAKRDRAIARRNAQKDPEPKEPEPKIAAATKDDLRLMTLNAAKKLVPQEVLEVWDDLKSVPLGGFDSLDADSVATNMTKRYNLYRMDNPLKEDDPASAFRTSPHIPVSGSGPKATPKKEEKPLPGYKEPVQPTDWYPKEE